MVFFRDAFCVVLYSWGFRREALNVPGRKQTHPAFFVTGGQQGEEDIPRYFRPETLETHGFFQDIPPR